MSAVIYTAVGLAAYLLGSIPTGYLLAKANGIDIRTAGSGNIGATNAFRVLGKAAGIFVLTADALKGFLPVKLFPALACQICPGRSLDSAAAAQLLAITAALGAILGHNFPCWLKFRGGKGIATSAGAMLAMVPAALLTAFAVWLVVFLVSRYVSLGSICAALVLPLAAWWTRPADRFLVAACGVVGALAIVKHRANIRRLLRGTEHRFGSNKPSAHTP